MNKITDLHLNGSKIVSVKDFEKGYFGTDSICFSDIVPLTKVKTESVPEKGSFIRTEILLPKNWNGIFIGLGNGGKGVNAIFADENRNGLLVALRRWCEEGKEPECIFAAHLDFNSENQNGSRLKKIYPYRGDRSETSDFPVSCDVKYLEKQ